ncbi:hypothetical protein J3E68DRAFT_396187 [Trichoderma sp. SZMC 28012]
MHGINIKKKKSQMKKTWPSRPCPSQSCTLRTCLNPVIPPQPFHFSFFFPLRKPFFHSILSMCRC